jgi:hypothetical protein
VRAAGVHAVRPGAVGGAAAGLLALAATGLLECAHAVYGELPNGFYSLDATLCEGVFRALLGEGRAEGAARIDPSALGRVLGLDRAPEVKTIRPKTKYLAEAGGRRLDRRDGRPACAESPRAGGGVLRRRACARLSGHPPDRENPCAAVEVPRPATVEPGSPMPPGIRCWW